MTGPDAAEFLQGQLTNDVRRLETEDEILAAWCNPKGRVICCGPLRGIEDGYTFSIPADLADDVVRRLTMFRFRSKVEFEIVDEGELPDPAALIDSDAAADAFAASPGCGSLSGADREYVIYDVIDGEAVVTIGTASATWRGTATAPVSTIIACQ